MERMKRKKPEGRSGAGSVFGLRDMYAKNAAVTYPSILPRFAVFYGFKIPQMKCELRHENGKIRQVNAVNGSQMVVQIVRNPCKLWHWTA